MRAGAMRLWNTTWMSAMLLALLAMPAAADKLDDVKARGKLVVGVSDTTPPFSFRKLPEDAIIGYDIDLVKGVAKRMGVALDMVPLSSAERIPLLQQDKLDFVATSMTRTRERLREIDFSHIYFVTPHAVIVRKESGITSVRQLNGRKASSASTSTAGGNLKDAVADVNIVYVRDYAQAFAALKAGEVDAFTTDETVLRAIVRQDRRPDDYMFLPDFTKSRDVGFALKKNEPRLKAAVNEALLDIESSGDAAKIWDAWFGPGTEAPMTRTFKIQTD
jgi:polar amino acid transport system substrate-binding protein